MPNIKSQVKRLRQSQKRTLRNKQIKAEIKTHISNFNKAVVKKDKKDAEKNLNQSINLLDKAASKGIIHKNKVANKKSKMARKFNTLKAVPKEKVSESKSKPTKSPATKPKKPKPSSK